MLIRCPECGKRISDRVEACPNCGAPQPASLRIAAAEQRRVARRKAVRITATVVIVALLAAATTFSLIYRWPISYEVGTVNGTDVVSREELLKIVDEAAATWNRAAGRTVAWHLPLGRKVEIDVQIDASLQQYLTTLAGLEQDEAALLATKDDAATTATDVRVTYDSETAASAPFVRPEGPIDFSKIRTASSPGGLAPTLQDVEEYAQIASMAAEKWTKAYDRLQAFKKAATYTDDPFDIDAGVSRIKGSPTRVVIAYFANTVTLTNVVVHQFGHVLLGTYGQYDSPSSVTAASLKSPWRFQLFGRNSQ